MSNSMNMKGKRSGQSNTATAGNYGQQVAAENTSQLSLSKTKDKIYTSYNYQSAGSKAGASSGTTTTTAAQQQR